VNASNPKHIYPSAAQKLNKSVLPVSAKTTTVKAESAVLNTKRPKMSLEAVVPKAKQPRVDI